MFPSVFACDAVAVSPLNEMPYQGPEMKGKLIGILSWLRKRSVDFQLSWKNIHADGNDKNLSAGAREYRIRVNLLGARASFSDICALSKAAEPFDASKDEAA